MSGQQWLHSFFFPVHNQMQDFKRQSLAPGIIGCCSSKES